MTPHEFKRKFFASYPREQQHRARAEWKKARQQAYLETQNALRFSWEQDLPSDIGRWAKDEFEDIIGEHEFSCVDNLRVARFSKPSLGKKQYRVQLRRGCCGYFDTKRVGPDGHTYKLGFNHGH